MTNNFQISLIWAMDKNHLIGKKNQLPWRLPNDLKHFKEETWGKTIVMGRKTFESFSTLLPHRSHVILTRQKDYKIESCQVIHTLEELLELSKTKEIYVIGGAEIYQLTLPFADRLIVTVIEAEFEGDTYFPCIDLNDFELISKQKGIQDEKNLYAHTFFQYQRKK